MVIFPLKTKLNVAINSFLLWATKKDFSDLSMEIVAV